MKIAITGSTGFIGTALRSSLEGDGHLVVPVVRSAARPGQVAWDPTAGTIDAAGLEGTDAVVHLAGEGIASGRWTDEHLHRVRESRRAGTDLMARTIAGLDLPPRVFVSGSAIGYYGDRGDAVLTEASGPGTDLLAEICVEWEGATAPAEEAGVRTAHIRTGIVLDPLGGALGKQLLAFKLGLGAKAGKGTQWMSWITLADEVAAIRHIVDTDTVQGPVNLTAPEPVTNAAFTKGVAQALHRPAFLTIPGFTKRLPLGVGGLVESLLFNSARVQPEVLMASGFTFGQPELAGALTEVLAS